MRNWLFVLTLVSTLSAPSRAQEGDTVLVGDWAGILNAGGQAFRLVLHVARIGDSLTATIDSPDQGARGIAARLRARPDSVFVMVGRAFSLEGVRDGLDTLRLVFIQGGARFPVSLARTTVATLPYEEREVTITGGSPTVRLSGTLSIPIHPRGPSVLLIAGSGPLTRDAVVAGHRQFAVLSDSLARAGFVVLRFDKRGVGKSTGSYESATTHDFFRDAEAILTELRRLAPDSNRLFVLGHSEGAMIAARLGAAQKVAGTILLAAPALSGDSLMIQRSQILAQNAGSNPATISQETALRSAILQAAVNAQNADEARRTMTSKVERGLSDLPTADQALPSFARANWMTLVDVIASQWLWFKDWLTRDPMPDYRALRSPVLAIVGEKDQQVPPALTTDRLRAALGSEAVRVLPSLNHLMQTATTGSPAEYATLREAMSPMAIASIIAWIGMQR